MTFHLERGGANPVRYTVEVHEMGKSLYWVGPPDLDAMEAVGLQKIEVSQKTMDIVFAASEIVRSENCETKLKNIAQTGKKVLVFGGPTRSSSCQFNYSDEESVNLAVAAMQAIAETIQAGERLAHAHRFDRLGLDALIDSFTEEVKDGRAIEVQNIRPILESIRDDERIMERVRRKAAHLLEPLK